MKTFEECRNEIAQKYDCDDWEMLMLNLKQSDIRKTEFEVMKEAAELYAKEKAKEAIGLARKNHIQWRKDLIYTEQEILDKLFRP